MKTFKIEKKNSLEIMKVTLYQPPYEDENILNKTGWKSEDVIITDITVSEDK